MAWQIPKINWQTGDIPGANDFNRIEGNIQHLAYLLHAGWMEPSNDVLFSAVTERVVRTAGWQVVKSFRVYNPGRYRIKLEAAVGGGPAPYARTLIRVAGVGITGLTDSYKSITIDTPEYTMGPRYITVEAAAILADGYSEIYSYYPRVRNVRVCGRLTLNRPVEEVVLD